jgi:subtilisin family serine protease
VINTDFQWAEPWYGVATDLNIYLLDSGGSIVAQSNNNNLLTQTPYELMYYNNPGSAADYSIVIARKSGSATPRLKYIFLQGTYLLTSVQYNTSTGGDIVGPTLYGHSATTYGLSVGAIPFNDSNNPEKFTSRGPSTFYFAPVVNTTPAEAIGPATMNQPDIAATDGGCTTFFGSYDYTTPCYRFYGTSAATPHAAAVAALILQRARAQNIPMSRGLMKWALQTSAQSVSGGTTASVGAGMVDALAGSARLDFLATLTKHLYLPALQR